MVFGFKTPDLSGHLQKVVTVAERVTKMDLNGDGALGNRTVKTPFPVFPKVPLSGSLCVHIERAESLVNRDGPLAGKSDSYVQIYVDGISVGQSEIKGGCLNPTFDEIFNINVSDEHGELRFIVWDYDDTDAADMLGWISFAIGTLIGGGELRGSFPLNLEGKDTPGGAGALHLSVKYTTAEVLYRSLDVPHTPFPPRQGCRVTLFQDAHTDGNPVSTIYTSPPATAGRRKCHQQSDFDFHTLEDTDPFEAPGGVITHVPRNCWEQIYSTILGAKKFICITGWSVWVNMSLLRRRPINGTMLTTGELLKQKAAEGVSVTVMIWDEKTSFERKYWTRADGMMGTHDEETRAYFEGTGVHCLLAQRRNGERLMGFYVNQMPDLLRAAESGFLWTHHQKSIICDAPELVWQPGQPAYRRRIVAFVGGLDITNGRWDTPQHTLYRSLQAEHKDDFSNNVTSLTGVTQEFGPREPWEDIHSKVEGQVARDVLHNFQSRWTAQDKNRANELYDIFGDRDIIPADEDFVYEPNHPQTWTVQLFRSLDHDVVTDLNGIDSSIQQAYVHHIRRARDFIFMENQYFLGSSDHWEGNAGKDVGATHLVPIEIVRKITESILHGRRFAAYIIIPMFPEGKPESGAVQEILHFQRETITMMYKKIALAISQAGINAHPCDYLNFFCLGNRETTEGSQSTATSTPPPGSSQAKLNESRRCMIYVHSKMIICDDEWILVGSANINQRSMAGSRDSEIAIGAYQPWHTAEHGAPRGEIHAFRMSLWHEHTGTLDNTYVQPSSLDCVVKIREMALQNWDAYTGYSVQPLPYGHLLAYPYNIDSAGNVNPKCEYFPDSEGKVGGTSKAGLPNPLTT